MSRLRPRDHNAPTRRFPVSPFAFPVYRSGVQKKRDLHDVIASVVATLVDALAVYAGLTLAIWLRFHLDWFQELFPDKLPPPLEHLVSLRLYFTGVAVLTFRFIGLQQRPEFGRFEDKIPRIIRAILTSLLLYIAVEAAARLDPQFPRAALVMSVFTLTFTLLLARYILYRIEWNLARHMEKINHVLVVGTDEIAVRLQDAIHHEPFLRSDIVGFLSTGIDPPAPELDPAQLLGTVDDLPTLLADGPANQVILADIEIKHARMVHIIVACEKQYATFYLVPDMFRILTSGVEVQNMGSVPVIGMKKWPLDFLHKRFLKRSFDLCGALVGLLLAAPVIAIAAGLIKATSPGPVFYRQERCGQTGQSFIIYKLRTMRADAESDETPGWTTEDDPRRTRVGVCLRRSNIDELPQFWNVFKGDMSLVGPRPERPFYVEQFGDEIERYMRRHVQRPGITGWAQVNGLRGDTSIAERIKFDLYYLENWSLAFDVKIILKTLFARANAY